SRAVAGTSAGRELALLLRAQARGGEAPPMRLRISGAILRQGLVSHGLRSDIDWHRYFARPSDTTRRGHAAIRGSKHENTRIRDAADSPTRLAAHIAGRDRRRCGRVAGRAPARLPIEGGDSGSRLVAR